MRLLPALACNYLSNCNFIGGGTRQKREKLNLKKFETRKLKIVKKTYNMYGPLQKTNSFFLEFNANFLTNGTSIYVGSYFTLLIV